MKSPALRSLAIQVGAAGPAFGIVVGAGLSGWQFAWLAGALAAAFSILARQPRWWWPMHFMFMPAVFVARDFQIAPAWFLLAFVLVLLIYWNSFRHQVPLYLSNADTAGVLLRLIEAERAQVVVDVGCGTGGFIAALARAQPQCRFVGIENAPLPWLVAKLRTARLPNCRIELRDFWKVKLENAGLVYAFLSPVPMARLWQKLGDEMKPGTLLVSNSFEVPMVQADTLIDVDDARRSRLLCYRIRQR